MSYGSREPPPPGLNGWARWIDSEVEQVQRQLDDRAGLIRDHETRIRILETQGQDHEHHISHWEETIEDQGRRLDTQERFARIVIAILAVLAGKMTPEMAIAILSALPVRM